MASFVPTPAPRPAEDPGGSLFPVPGPGERRALEETLAGIEKVFPLPARFRRTLPRDVAELSRLLTSGRGERNEGYLGQAALLSAYLRYFLPWNLYRLSRLLPSLPISLTDGDALTDLGSGPLTLPLALWLFRPELREKKLEFRCLDRTGAALDAGKRLFAALAGPGWTIRTIRAPLGAPIKGGRAALVTAVNLFDELIRDVPAADSPALKGRAEKLARLLSALTAEAGSLLVVEPGVPRSGEFIAALRGALVELGRFPLSPCPHAGPCSLGGTEKWCHFAFETEGAPEALRRLSAAAGLPKERAVLTFLLAGPAGTPENPVEGTLPVRILSDAFPVQPEPAPGPADRKPDRNDRYDRNGRYGRYGCSPRGLVLIRGTKADLESRGPGTLLSLPRGSPENRDPKSGVPALDLVRPQHLVKTKHEEI